MCLCLNCLWSAESPGSVAEAPAFCFRNDSRTCLFFGPSGAGGSPPVQPALLHGYSWYAEWLLLGEEAGESHFYFLFHVWFVLLKAVMPLEKNVSCNCKAELAWEVCDVKTAERWKLRARQSAAPFCSVPDGQVNNCRTSWQTKELAQLLTQGRWESCQHKTTGEWSCLSGSYGSERVTGRGWLCSAHSSGLLESCANPARLPQPPLTRALWAACL